MICPKCGAEGATKKGSGRGYCAVGDHSFKLPQASLTQPDNLPDGVKLRGTSTLTDVRTGETVLQWVKTTADAEAQRKAMEAAIVAMAEKLPREKPRALPAHCNAALLNQYTITDYHLGMLAWGEETGADWDLRIAEQMLVDWFGAAIALAPAANTAVFAQIGDFLHFDGLEAVTPAHHNLLDADTRFQKLVRVAIRAIRRVIGLLLSKHRHVLCVMAEGNHDPASSIWLREWLAAIYEDEPRVTVDVSPDPYYCIEWGETALFYHHGHKRRPADIDSVFVAKYREVFGRTKYAYAHMGHMHHVDVKETNLMIIEQHRTLAAKDAYASRGGWMAGRDAQVITYHRAFGEVGRVRISPQMLEAA